MPESPDHEIILRDEKNAEDQIYELEDHAPQEQLDYLEDDQMNSIPVSAPGKRRKKKRSKSKFVKCPSCGANCLPEESECIACGCQVDHYQIPYSNRDKSISDRYLTSGNMSLNQRVRQDISENGLTLKTSVVVLLILMPTLYVSYFILGVVAGFFVPGPYYKKFDNEVSREYSFYDAEGKLLNTVTFTKSRGIRSKVGLGRSGGSYQSRMTFRDNNLKNATMISSRNGGIMMDLKTMQVSVPANDKPPFGQKPDWSAANEKGGGELKLLLNPDILITFSKKVNQNVKMISVTYQGKKMKYSY